MIITENYLDNVITLEITKAEYIEEYMIKITFDDLKSNVIDFKKFYIKVWTLLFKDIKM